MILLFFLLVPGKTLICAKDFSCKTLKKSFSIVFQAAILFFDLAKNQISQFMKMMPYAVFQRKTSLPTYTVLSLVPNWSFVQLLVNLFVPPEQ